MDFKDTNIKTSLVKQLQKSGIKELTPIQERAIPLIKAGRDIIAEAQTGTGKTLAFLLPIFDRLDPEDKSLQALVLTPTRELALQIAEVAKSLAQAEGIGVMELYGGRNIGAQQKKLKGSVQVVIATPGRLLDHIERDTLALDRVKYFVLDEADQMLVMGFKNEVDRIIRLMPRNRQTLCFSATMKPGAKKLAFQYTFQPETITIAPKEVTVASIHQEVVITTDRQKYPALIKALDADNPFLAIIFCRTKRRADELLAKMKKEKYNVGLIHSDIPQNKRERILKSFRDAKLQYLIATDVASRGLDISGITHIYNFDVPELPETYIHRIGRTGRVGADGYTCMFVTPASDLEFNMIERRLRSNIPRREL